MESSDQKTYCAYCNSEYPDTDDHIIPRGWFPKSSPIKVPLVVKACKSCNAKKSKDDEWLRKWFTSMISDQSPDALEVLYGPVARSIQRLPTLGHEMINQMDLVDVYDKETGALLGRQTRVKISDENWERIFGWVSTVVHGLYVWDKKRPFPIGYAVRTFYGGDEWFNPNEAILKPMLPSIPFPKAWHLEDAGVFAFGRAYTVESEGVSVWITSFYNKVSFISFVGGNEWIQKHDDHAKQNPKVISDIGDRYVFVPVKEDA